MSIRLISTLLGVFLTICLFQTTVPSDLAAADTQGDTAYKISTITKDIGSDTMSLVLVGNKAPAYTVSERFDPFRLVVDIAQAEFNPSIDMENILPDTTIATLHVSLLKDQTPNLARLELAIAEDTTYDVKRDGNNISIQLKAVQATVATPPETAGDTPSSTGISDAIFDAPAKNVDLLQPEKKSASPEAEELEDSFSFSGYKTERVSVDFYKIDLHNVFRLFRQISNKNIIVDEAVNGSITLALNNVPWDFALDVVLNIAGLKKQERFDTIVIYPQNKEFNWPARALDNLSFEADSAVVDEEALIIEQSAIQPKEIMQARELLVKARDLEKTENFEEAALLYEEAFKLWPANTKLSNKLANMYLGRLRMNAKAFYYAQKTLESEPTDTQAALYSAISSANMDRIPEAMEFFAQSVSGNPPMKEALISYAAFSENNNQPEAALKLLETYSRNYGDNLQTMVSKARIYDKLGDQEKATAQYRALLSSGFQMRPDLKEYVEGRVSGGNR